MRRKLKETRENLRLTQQEIADIAGIKRSTYANIELGNKNPSYPVALRIKKALEYMSDDIFLVENVANGNNRVIAAGAPAAEAS